VGAGHSADSRRPLRRVFREPVTWDFDSPSQISDGGVLRLATSYSQPWFAAVIQQLARVEAFPPSFLGGYAGERLGRESPRSLRTAALGRIADPAGRTATPPW